MNHDDLPQPLLGAPALRAHLKALERGVADARSQRLGVPSSPARAPVSHGMSNTLGAMIGTHDTSNQTSPYVMPKPGSTQPSVNQNTSGKPRAARAKGSADFGSFFNSIEKRAAS